MLPRRDRPRANYDYFHLQRDGNDTHTWAGTRAEAHGWYVRGGRIALRVLFIKLHTQADVRQRR